MVSTPIHKELLVDDQSQKIGEEFANIRGKHLLELGNIEQMVRSMAPLPISYDVARLQPPYFSEFTYTEMLGNMYICPQSSEITARLVLESLKDESQYTFNVIDHIEARDKYELNEVDGPTYKRVAFLPGSNIFNDAVSRDLLHRAMADFEDLVIKPHPLTNPDHIRWYSGTFGAHRILDPMESGWYYLKHAEEVFVTTTTEMGLYATLDAKPIHNVTRFEYEARGAYNAFYRPLWNVDTNEAQTLLRRSLNSPLSGFFHKCDPQLEMKIKKYYELAMLWREFYKPLVFEMTNIDWASTLVNRGKPIGDINAIRKS